MLPRRPAITIRPPTEGKGATSGNIRTNSKYAGLNAATAVTEILSALPQVRPDPARRGKIPPRLTWVLSRPPARASTSREAPAWSVSCNGLAAKKLALSLAEAKAAAPMVANRAG